MLGARLAIFFIYLNSTVTVININIILTPVTFTQATAHVLKTHIQR